MPVIYSNNASTTLSAGINDSTTTIGISSASGFPSISGSNYYFATIANTNNTKIEVVKVTAGTTSLTVTRAQDGTTAQAFDSGDNFQVRVTAATLEAATKTDVNITGGAIAGAAISNDVIDSQHYAAASIDNEHLADNAVGTAEIADDAVTADKLANSINSAIAANTAKVTNATHSGEVTGATALTIADDIVDEANLKVSNDPTNGYFLSAQSGNTGGLTWAEVDTTIANDAIDSQHYAAGSIDLEHLASESVDEDNLYISNAGSNGQFLSKQSGNDGGLTWATVSSEDFIPNGSVMAFFQAAAPTGWTKITTQNDKVLRVVSGNGGGTGGDWAMSAGETTSEVGAHTHTSAAHTHTGASHTHTGASHSHGGGNMAAAATTISTSTMPSHSHSVPYGSGNTIYSANSIYYQPNFDAAGATGSNTGNTASTGGGGSHSHGMSGNTAATTPGNGGATTPGAGGSTTPGATGSANAHTHTIQAPQYIDVIICSKDA
jgi:hypothetical protein